MVYKLPAEQEYLLAFCRQVLPGSLLLGSPNTDTDSGLITSHCKTPCFSLFSQGGAKTRHNRVAEIKLITDLLKTKNCHFLPLLLYLASKTYSYGSFCLESLLTLKKCLQFGFYVVTDFMYILECTIYLFPSRSSLKL